MYIVKISASSDFITHGSKSSIIMNLLLLFNSFIAKSIIVLFPLPHSPTTPIVKQLLYFIDEEIELDKLLII